MILLGPLDSRASHFCFGSRECYLELQSILVLLGHLAKSWVMKIWPFHCRMWYFYIKLWSLALYQAKVKSYQIVDVSNSSLLFAQYILKFTNI